MKFRSCSIIITCLFFAACGGNQKPVDLTAQTKQANKYQYATVAEKMLSTSAQLPGQLVPFNEVNLFPKVNGFVKQILVDRGSDSKTGPVTGSFGSTRNGI